MLSRCAESWPCLLCVLSGAGAGNVVDCVCGSPQPQKFGSFLSLLLHSRHSTCPISFKISLFLLTWLYPCLNAYLARGRPHVCVFNCVVKLCMNKTGAARGRLRHGHLLTSLQVLWNLHLSDSKCLSSLLVSAIESALSLNDQLFLKNLCWKKFYTSEWAENWPLDMFGFSVPNSWLKPWGGIV